jgi:hypothetical protein
MNPERWRQISQLYSAVLAQDTTARPTFLADACGVDADLRETLESLLAQQDSAEHLLNVRALEVAAQVRSEAEMASTTPMEGRRFGAYRILHEIGRGGMGSVYLADRVDETFHKRVAIKDRLAHRAAIRVARAGGLCDCREHRLPFREQWYDSAAHIIVVVPGFQPYIARTLMYVSGLLLSHAVMRSMAGPARDDDLARSRWSTST